MKNASSDESYDKPTQLTYKTRKLSWELRYSLLAHGVVNQLVVGATFAQGQDPAQRSVEIAAVLTEQKYPDATTALGQEHCPTATTAQTTGASIAILMATVWESAKVLPPKCSTL